MAQKIVIIGGGAAGPKTASKLKREKPDTIIDLYTDIDVVSYSACGLPYYIGGDVDDIQKLIVRTPEQFEKQGISIHLKQRCIDIKVEEKTAIIEDLNTRNIYGVSYDILVIATGSRPYIPVIENCGLKNIFTLRTIDDALKIKEIMNQSKTVTIIGGGYIGIEILEAFVKNGLKVNLIDINKHIMHTFDDEISKLIQEHILKKDGEQVNIINLDKVVKFLGDEEGRVNKVITNEGIELDTDFVVIASGVVPNTELVDKTNIKKGLKNTIWINSHLQTSIPNIYAAGDCVEKNHIITHRYTWIPMGSTANKEGRCVALNIAGENCNFEGVIGSAVSRYFAFTMSMTGLSEKRAIALGFDAVSATVTKKDKAGYMPEVNNITIKLIVDRNSRHILGAQAIGCGEANQRIATVTSAITRSTNLDDFVNLDLPYAPPYSPAIDPLLNAAQIIYDKIEKYQAETSE